MKRILAAVAFSMILAYGALRWYDHATVGRPVAQALAADLFGDSYTLEAGRQHGLPLGTLVLDVCEVHPRRNMDEISVLLRCASALHERGRAFGRGLLSRDGETMLVMPGERFWEAGAIAADRGDLDSFMRSLPATLSLPDRIARVSVANESRTASHDPGAGGPERNDGRLDGTPGSEGGVLEVTAATRPTPESTILISSWSDGLFVVTSGGVRQELAGRSVESLSPDGPGAVLGILDRRILARRGDAGTWAEVAELEPRAESCLRVGEVTYAGTEGAHLLRIRDDGHVERVEAFDQTPGRESWFAGSAVVDGRVVGPPLSVRSLAASTEGGVILAAAHVGGIVRSEDDGRTWSPTIDIEWDVHEVRVHPEDPTIAAAAAAVGLCISRDGGETWALETFEDAGLDLRYCSAMAFCGEDLYVAVSSDHFASTGSLCRRPIAPAGSLERVEAGLPDWLDGIVDTGCIAAKDRELAVVDRGGTVYRSDDAGEAWGPVARGIPDPSSALLL